MENHWMFVFLVVFLRLAIAEKGSESPPSVKTAAAAAPSSIKSIAASLSSIKSASAQRGTPATPPETGAPPSSPKEEEPVSTGLPPSTGLSEFPAETTRGTNTTTSDPQKTEPPKLNNEIDDDFDEGQSDVASEEVNEQINKADAALSDFLKQVLEELRVRMKTGMSGNEDNEVLDPLSLEDMKLAPLVAGEVFDVKMEKITLTGLSDFRITQLESQVRESRIKLGIHYPQIQANCMFAANGTLYDIFTVEGNGNATLVFNEVHARTVIYMTRENGTLQVTSADQPYVDFSSASITFRDDTKGGQEVKAENVATQLGPLYFWVLTASAVERVDYPLALYLNEAMSKFMLPDILRKLTLRQRYLRIHVPNNPLPYAYVSPQLD